MCDVNYVILVSLLEAVVLPYGDLDPVERAISIMAICSFIFASLMSYHSVWKMHFVDNGPILHEL